MKRTERIPILVTKEEKKRIQKLAKEAGFSVSQYIRSKALNKIIIRK